MQITIESTQEEKNAISAAIKYLGEINHVKHMSYKLLADTAQLKETKVRSIVSDLIADKLIQRFNIGTASVPRYYYVNRDVQCDTEK